MSVRGGKCLGWYCTPMRWQRSTLSLLLALVVWNTASCGYSLIGTGSFLPDYIQTVAIPTFANTTPRFEVEVRITDAVTREFVSRGTVSYTHLTLPTSDLV